MRRLRAFGAFWFDFVVGDDPIVAVGVVVGLGLTTLLAQTTAAWWVLPVVTAALLALSLVREARAVRRARAEQLARSAHPADSPSPHS